MSTCPSCVCDISSRELEYWADDNTGPYHLACRNKYHATHSMTIPSRRWWHRFRRTT